MGTTKLHSTLLENIVLRAIRKQLALVDDTAERLALIQAMRRQLHHVLVSAPTGADACQEIALRASLAVAVKSALDRLMDDD
jgi:CheY-like chemotaxis protein